MELWVQIRIECSCVTCDWEITSCILRIRCFMTYVAGYVYIFQADQSFICVCNQQLYLTSGVYCSLPPGTCMSLTAWHQQTNAWLFRGYNVSALSSKGSLIERCTSIIPVSCFIQQEALFLGNTQVRGCSIYASYFLKLLIFRHRASYT